MTTITEVKMPIIITDREDSKTIKINFNENPTNGDIIKAMFPNLELRQSYDLSGLFNILENFQNVTFYEHWWNAPYKGGIDE